MHCEEIRCFYGMEYGGGYDAWKRTSLGGTPFDFDKVQNGKGGAEKQSKVCDVITDVPKRVKHPKAVDEDLYKIPPELLYKKQPKTKKIGRSFWFGCLGISCVP
ncbi:Biotin carboxylase protein [Dioscorea alata]|uniref:Biotin carboxylase protein n=1 Tax=Dioscorea alata TaxID=55571 RepID=A0ACB7WPL0_DIOAL|nr:Biotin carboxylase protein [Dioscorea alata]